MYAEIDDYFESKSDSNRKSILFEHENEINYMLQINKNKKQIFDFLREKRGLNTSYQNLCNYITRNMQSEKTSKRQEPVQVAEAEAEAKSPFSAINEITKKRK